MIDEPERPADEHDRDYFEQRAEAELEAAQSAEHPAVVKAHYKLAGLYLDRVYGPDEAGAPAAG